jgi:RNA polymerase-binding transcription factor DksA
MTQEEKDKIKLQINHEISIIEKSIDKFLELIDAEVQSDANDWFISKESNPSKEINEIALEKAKQRIVLHRSVLSRIDTSEYGICIKWHYPIYLERLKAIPPATRGLSCG